MFVYKLPVHDSLPRLKSIVCVAAEFLIVCKYINTKFFSIWTTIQLQKSKFLKFKNSKEKIFFFFSNPKFDWWYLTKKFRIISSIFNFGIANNWMLILDKIGDKTYLRARKRLPGNSLVGGAQTSKGALTVQKARMLHCYQLQWLPRNSSCNKK